MKRVKVGTKFRYTFADSNPEWTVMKSHTGGFWTCQILEDGDWTRAVKTFTTKEIIASIQMSEYLKKTVDDSDDYFDNLPTNSIVHYNNGFNGFVRCKVTADKQLLPIDLIGNWLSHDLPRRERDGSIYYGYHASNILEKKVFRPNASNVYEYNLTRSKNQQPIAFSKWVDPRKMDVVSLEVSEQTDEQKKLATLWKKIDAIRRILNENNNRNPAEILKDVSLTIG